MNEGGSLAVSEGAAALRQSEPAASPQTTANRGFMYLAALLEPDIYRKGVLNACEHPSPDVMTPEPDLGLERKRTETGGALCLELRDVVLAYDGRQDQP